MTTQKTKLDTIAVALLLACCIFWGFQQVLVKATVPEVAPVFQASLRFLGAAVLLWVWCLLRGIPLFKRDGSLVPGLMAGALFAAEFACVYAGLQYTAASRLTVFLYTSPFWVALLLPLRVAGQSLVMRQWAGLICAFGAVAFVLWGGSGTAAHLHQDTHFLGDVLGLAAGLLWGLTTVTIRGSSLMRVSAEKLLFYQIALSAITLPCLSRALGEDWSWSFSGFAIASLAAQSVLGAFISFLAWMWMLGRYPTTMISVFVFLTPLFAVLFGSLWLKEPVTPTLLAALALVALGIFLVNKNA